VEAEIEKLKGETRTDVDVLEDAGELSLVIHELMGGSAYSEEARLGISPVLLNKFVKMKGPPQNWRPIYTHGMRDIFMRQLLLSKKSNGGFPNIYIGKFDRLPSIIADRST